jgi:hypothetical protein
VGDSADEGRQAAAASLAKRLLRLHEGEGVAWGAMACLFRASTHFGVYEEAFEAASIPYVTVAGKGFFDRPEVRDLLNALRVVVYPADDLAMAGLLRSPAIGLTDASLYLLRWGPDGKARPLWAALRDDLSALTPPQQACARRDHPGGGRPGWATTGGCGAEAFPRSDRLPGHSPDVSGDGAREQECGQAAGRCPSQWHGGGG